MMYWRRMFGNRPPRSGFSSTIIDKDYIAQTGNGGKKLPYKPHSISITFQYPPKSTEPFRPSVLMTFASTIVFSDELVEAARDLLDGVQVVPLKVFEHDGSPSAHSYNFVNVMSIIDVHDPKKSKWDEPEEEGEERIMCQIKVNKKKLEGAPHLFIPKYMETSLFVSEEFCKRYDSIGGTGILFVTTDNVYPLKERPKPKKRRGKKSDP